MTLKLFIGNFPPPQVGYFTTYAVSSVEQNDTCKEHLSSESRLLLWKQFLHIKISRFRFFICFLGFTAQILSLGFVIQQAIQADLLRQWEQDLLRSSVQTPVWCPVCPVPRKTHEAEGRNPLLWSREDPSWFSQLCI